MGATRSGRGRGQSVGWRQFVVGAVVGALVGGGTAAGVAVATRNENSGSGRTVVVRSAAQPVRASSTIGSTGNIQTVLSKLDGAVVAVQTGDAVDSGLFNGSSASGTGGAGTGFIIDSDGVIVTNNHVVEGAGGRIEVVFGDGTRLKATLLGRSAQYDLAVLKVEAHALPTLKLGSSDALQVGDEVVAVGNALALDGSNLSVTKGIISGKGRVVPEDQTGITLYDMLQTDAAINPGNSGGPLVDAQGRVIGINTALAGGSQNVGFAISIDSVKAVIQDLRDGKNVKVPFLGVESGDVTPAVVRSLNLKTKNGAVVRRVTKGTGAEQAGLKPNDVIVAIDGRPITGPQDVGAEIRRFSPGATITVTIERGGSQQDLKVTLGTRPDSLG
ncbi:MAG: trypsin-like peptidase domain-containing protein [Acidimicrobiia bacterium]